MKIVLDTCVWVVSKKSFWRLGMMLSEWATPNTILATQKF